MGTKVTENTISTKHKNEILPFMVVYLITIHISGFYGICAISSAKWATLVFMYVYFVCGCLGITAGGHRLWSHRSYKAKLPLQILLMLFHSAAMQFSVYRWVQKHRQHHKYSDTDADPHNSSRGFWFSHVGWLVVRPHREVLQHKTTVHMADIERNPVLAFQKRYIWSMLLTMALILPICIPQLWSEDIRIATHINCLRLALTYHASAMINSVAHKWGYRPFDKEIPPSQSSIVSFCAFGEGYHNFHHVFPWDYRTGELGSKVNFTTFVIDCFSKIGWAYDLKSVNEEDIVARALKSGDGSEFVTNLNKQECVNFKSGDKQ